MTKTRKKTRKVYKNFEFELKGLVLIRRADKTILVEPLNIRSDLQRKIIELAGLD